MSSMIQIVVPGAFVDSWGSKLLEYQNYVLNNFKVEDNDLLSRACPNPLKLIWFDGTFISYETVPPIPNINFVFKDFAEILSENFHPDDIHDIIGTVHEVTFHQRKDNRVAAVSFVLQDNKRVLIEFFLWGGLATNFLNGVRHDVGVEPTVVIIRNAIYCAAYDDWPVSLSNGSHGTRIFTDQSIPEIIDFKNSLHERIDPVVTIKIGDMQNIASRESYLDYSGLDCKIIRIDEAQLEQELSCVTIGVTKKIMVSRYGWTFEGCAWCGRGVFVSEGYLKCSNDHRNPRVTPSLYKLHIEVTYDEENTIFIFSDSACANFFGISALELKRSLSTVCISLNFKILEGYLKCSNDHRNPRVTPRYKLHIEVTYDEENTIFIFSDSACANFFGISALELKRSLSTDNQVDARFCPLLLDSLLGLRIVAKGRWSPTFRSMFVDSFQVKSWKI
ncbi:hypothetical protein QL285_010066 [Trifolium repens]|nr:hypothetical protein QL285_010066 [Trifolium repens]